ncbi:TPA: phage tail tape measure protein [Escherichia coli]|nr:phage tail tape measure protein [Escherichia coli]
MNLEALPKYYSPKSPKLSDDAPATGSGGLTITDVMAAQGMVQSKAPLGFALFLAKVGVQDPQFAIEGLLNYAMALDNPTLNKLSEETRLQIIPYLVNFAFADYSRSAASKTRCEHCAGTGFHNVLREVVKHSRSGESVIKEEWVGKRTGVLKAIFGDDAETLQVVNALIDKGKDGYDQIQQKMNKQASLNKRVQAQLGTLSNLWEAMTGTATNGLAAIGGAFSGDAKNITQWLGELGEKFTKFADENPRVIRGVVGLAAGLAILKLELMGVGSAISIVSRIMSMTPIGMIATAIALAAGLIITNWDVVGPYFKKLWETIGPYFEAGWELLKKVFAWSPMGMVINNWGPVVKWFQDMWDKLKPIIEWFTDSSGDTVDAINSAQWGAGAYDAYGTGIPARGYTPYPAVDPAQANNASDATGSNPFMINKATAPKVDGEIKVSFINMPPGMRVTETRSSGIDINHDVGYTRFW